MRFSRNKMREIGLSDVSNSAATPRQMSAPKSSAANSNAASKEISKNTSRNANSSSSIGSFRFYAPGLKKISRLACLTCCLSSFESREDVAPDGALPARPSAGQAFISHRTAPERRGVGKSSQCVIPLQRIERGVPSRLLSVDDVSQAVIHLATDRTLAGRVLLWWSEDPPRLIR